MCLVVKGHGRPDVPRITGLLEKSAQKTHNKITPAGVVAAAATAIIPLLFNVGGGLGNRAPSGNVFDAGRVIQELHSTLVETIRAGVEANLDHTLFAGLRR